MSAGTPAPVIYRSSHPSGGPYRDDLDIYELMFDYFPPSRPDIRNTGIPLLIDDATSHSLTFEQIRHRVDAVSLSLYHDYGLRPDAVVGLFSANHIDYPTAIWASHRIGLTISAANPAYTAGELSYQLATAKCTALVVHEDALDIGLAAARKAGIRIPEQVIVLQSVERTRAASPGSRPRPHGCRTLEEVYERGAALLKQKGQRELDETRRRLKTGEGQSKLAFISFSSGTTGLPKGVAIQHYAPVSNVLQTFAFNRISSRVRDPNSGRFRPGVDRALGLLPMFHIYGLVLGLHTIAYAGIPNVVVPRYGGIESMLQSIVKHSLTLYFWVPPMVVSVCKDPVSLKYRDSMRKLAHFIMIGAAPLSDDLSRQLDAYLGRPNVACQGYGMTESATLTLMGAPGVPTVLGSVGTLVSDVEARIVRPDGADCAPGEPGELWVRSPSVTLGYINNRQATEEMFLQDGFMKTGDEVLRDDQDNWYIVDRLKELIKTKGFQVAPAELEGFLLDHADISDAGVIGVPDEAAGELPLAFISLSSDAKQRIASASSPAEKEAEALKIKKSVMQFVKDNKVHYKRLCDVQIIDAIPKNPSGKILRRQLRDQAKKLPVESRAKL